MQNKYYSLKYIQFRENAMYFSEERNVTTSIGGTTLIRDVYISIL